MRPAVVLLACALLGCAGGHKSAATAPAYASGPASYADDESVSETIAASAAPVARRQVAADAAVTPNAAVAAPPPLPGERALPEKLVVEGYLRAEVEDVRAAAVALRAEVERVGGRVISENVTGAAESWSAALKLRVPPGQVDGVLDWLTDRGQVVDKRLSATDVSRTLFEQEIEIGNKRAALERLRKVLEQGGLTMTDVLAIERELTRLRGEIEQLEGARRFLEDRVQLATLDVYLTRRDGAVLSPRSKFYPGPRLAVLTLLDADGRARNRLGGGVALHVPVPRLSFELDVFEEEASPDGARHRSVLATFGGAVYSDFLGRGRRSYLNPYLGLRAGYGYLDGHAFAVQGEVGLELFKNEHLLFDLNSRMTGFLARSQVDAALVTGASLIVAF
jgi:hypothetical protein